MPTLKVNGVVNHDIGSWGLSVPVKNATIKIIDIDYFGNSDDIIWSGETDENGVFSGESSDWQDRIIIPMPVGRDLEFPDPNDSLELVINVVDGSREVTLPYRQSRSSQTKTTVPWGPQSILLILKPISNTSSLSGISKIKKKDFKEILKNPKTHILTKKTIGESIERVKIKRLKDYEIFRKTFETERKDIVDSYENFSINKPSKLLNPVESFVGDMVLCHRLLNDKKHQLKSYEIMHARCKYVASRLSDSNRDQALTKISTLRTPSQLINRSLESINEAIIELSETALETLGTIEEPKPSNYPLDCKEEEGTGFGGDMEENHNSTRHDNGLYNNTWWPLKWYTTCIRSQGNRGSCVAFGMTAAVECAIAAKYNRWVNLSEQDLYMHQKLHWFPAPWDWYGDGYSPLYSLLVMNQFGNYVFPYEKDWDYNKSLCRKDNEQSRTYKDSCIQGCRDLTATEIDNNTDNLVKYSGEACSNTNHQAKGTRQYIELTTVREEVNKVCNWIEDAVDDIPIIGGFISDAIGEYVCEPVIDLIETVENIEVGITYTTPTVGTSGFKIGDFRPIFNPSQVKLES